jgi:glycogen debranching enzyme
VVRLVFGCVMKVFPEVLMALEIKVGPTQLAIHHGQSVLVTEQNGEIGARSDKGFYFFDTRLISSWKIYANGETWELLNSGSVTYFAYRVFLANRAILTEDGEIAPHTLGLVLSRSIGDGFHEDIDLTNHSAKPVRFNLEIAIRGDFADIFEVKAKRIVRRGRIATDWLRESAKLAMIYHNKDFSRALIVRPYNNDSPVVYANGRLSFEIALEPGTSWHSCLSYEIVDGERRFESPINCIEHTERSKFWTNLKDWQHGVLKIRTSNEEIYRLFRQAVEDMQALRLSITGTEETHFVPAAGMPWFVALFGRDSLIVSIQNMLVYPDFARGALAVLGSLQATERDDFRDAEPGKIMHEMRHGELAHFKLVPHTPYYGTADATILYLIVLHDAWRWSGDQGLIERHLSTAERCLEWIDEYGDRDGDGFQEYETRSPVGYENQSWKDAGEAVVYPDGSLVKGPNALCELQGYVYDAWLRMAEIYDQIGKADRALDFRQKAQVLFHNFNEAFWDEDSGFYAYALDGSKKKVLSVVSNPGHCLWSGIVPPDRAARVVARLMKSDMWSGWGIRTLSAEHPSFNPYSYQNGSVWPHDNGIIALGFKRYGFAAEAAQIARDVSEAGSFFMLHQLPELYAGIQRDETNFPVQYLGANVPQAWAAGSVFSFLQAILGVQPDAPNGRLYINPVLPSWLPDLTLIDLRLGDKCFDVRFWRTDEKTRFEVLKGDPGAIIMRKLQVAGLTTAATEAPS